LFTEAKLAELLAHVADASDRFRDGELNAFEVDQVQFQYARAAKELWKFFKSADIEIIGGHVLVRLVREQRT
jgi:hypothetical protein